TPTFAKLFTPEDSRNLLLKSTDTIEKLTDFDQGVYVYKYTNVTSDNKPGSHLDFCDMDFPLFRLAEMYLIYAECAARGAADKGKGLDYLNEVRSRAGIAPAGSLDLSQIIDERGRELYWEGHRRTDLIRFGLFTSGSYLWEWKGGKASGAAMTADRALYPIPASDALANPNLRPQSK
uniref:RagB/SusD family nutrient uptake outer membrane protein n=1 Tax=uncultured Porphyromonas sp. TaxID=159274 RepID=UPI0025D9C2AD